QRPSAEAGERLRAVSAEPLAPTRGSENGPDHALSGRRDLRGRLLLLAAASEDAVEPLGGFLLVHVLGVHELAGEDLLRLHEHLLLAGRETLLVVAEREVPNHLGELEDVAGLPLIAVLLESE